MEILKGLAEIIAAPQDSPALRSVIAANPGRISLKPDNPEEAILIDDRAGTMVRGHLDPNGDFRASEESRG